MTLTDCFTILFMDIQLGQRDSDIARPEPRLRSQPLLLKSMIARLPVSLYEGWKQAGVGDKSPLRVLRMAGGDHFSDYKQIFSSTDTFISRFGTLKQTEKSKNPECTTSHPEFQAVLSSRVWPRSCLQIVDIIFSFTQSKATV